MAHVIETGSLRTIDLAVTRWMAGTGLVRGGRLVADPPRPAFGADASAGEAPSLAETLRLHALSPERQWLFGIERVNPQQGVRLAKGGHVWLY